MGELRKRKFSQDKEEAISPVKNPNEERGIIKVVKLNSVLTLLVGILIGSSFGVPWMHSVLDILRGYRWDSKHRCILESPDKSGYGVDFCRIPADCNSCRDISSVDEIHINDLSIDLFYDKYAYSNRPLVVRNATLHWPAMEVLDYYWLKDAYHSDPSILEYEDESCWFNKYKTTLFRNLASVFRLQEKLVTREGRDLPRWYVGWSVCQKAVAEKLFQLYERPSFIDPESTPPTKQWIFIGTPGPGASPHIDNVDLPSWQAQIRGVKTWFLSVPPECSWACHPTMQTTIYPGDIIVLNTNFWFHSTQVLGEELSLVITNEFD